MRFGYTAERVAQFQLGLVWVPVGVTYTAKQQIRSDVLIRVGRPFGLKDLGLGMETNEARALQAGTQRLQRDLEAMVVSIEQEELVPLIDQLTELITRPGAGLLARSNLQRQVARVIQYFNSVEPGPVTDLQQAVHSYTQRLAAAGLEDHVIHKQFLGPSLRTGPARAVTEALLGLVSLYGWVNSLVPRNAAFLTKPLGRQRLKESGPHGAKGQVLLAREALWGAFGGWTGAALAFPLQTYLLFRWAASHCGIRSAMATTAVYGVSIVPAWRFSVRYRDRSRQLCISQIPICLRS